jgi:DNA-binding SARP family transcriptional activator
MIAGSSGDARLSLLGGFDLQLHSAPVALLPSAQRLLSFLALNPGALPRGYVAGNLWADSCEVRANSSLRSTLWRMRDRAPVIEKTDTHLALAPWVETDVAELTDASQRLIDDGAPPNSKDVFDLIHAGELLPGWYDDWLIVERERIRQRRLHMLELSSRRLSDAGRFSDALEAGLAAVAVEPLRESGHCAVIEAHLAEGNLIEASRQYELLRDLLREHLGVRPSRRVHQLLHGSTHAAVTAP